MSCEVGCDVAEPQQRASAHSSDAILRALQSRTLRMMEPCIHFISHHLCQGLGQGQQ
jgi:hypothetical protein